MLLRKPKIFWALKQHFEIFLSGTSSKNMAWANCHASTHASVCTQALPTAKHTETTHILACLASSELRKLASDLMQAMTDVGYMRLESFLFPKSKDLISVCSYIM